VTSFQFFPGGGAKYEKEKVCRQKHKKAKTQKRIFLIQGGQMPPPAPPPQNDVPGSEERLQLLL